MVLVRLSNLEEVGPGTLIRAFDKLNEIEDPQKVLQAIELQTKISQTLEKRGWVYEEDLGDWVYHL